MIRTADSRMALACADCGHRWEIEIDGLFAGTTGPECPECGDWVWSGDLAVSGSTPLTRRTRRAS